MSLSERMAKRRIKIESWAKHENNTPKRYTPMLPCLEQFVKEHESEPEYTAAVLEVGNSLTPFLTEHPEYVESFKKLLKPERIIRFDVHWVDDKGVEQVNKGYRVQYCNKLGPYKGGLRFHPSVNLSILQMLAFEQTFKNALTGLPMGGGKGGSDFDPKGKSEAEVERFCRAFMDQLYPYIGIDTLMSPPGILAWVDAKSPICMTNTKRNPARMTAP
jgi:glutamate dehydrogenase/leucine dehydrogenase